MKRLAFIAVIFILALTQFACALPFELPFALPFGLGGATDTPTPAPTRTPVSTLARTPTFSPSGAATAIPPTALRASATPTRGAVSPGVPTVSPQKSVTPPAGAGTKFTEKDGFYSLSVPAGWKTTTKGERAQFCADDAALTCLSVTLRIKAVYPQQVLEDTLITIESRAQTYAELDRVDVTLAGLDGLHSTIRYQLNQKDVAAEVYAVNRNRVGFEVITWQPFPGSPAAQAVFDPMLASLTVTAFKDAPDYENWDEYLSENLVFYTLPGTYAGQNIQQIAAAHEQAYIAIQQALGLDYFEPIFYFLYPNDNAFFHSTYRTSGFAIDDYGEVHAKWFAANNHQTVGHEMVHVIARGVLGPAGQALMGEGLAACLDQDKKDYRALGKALVTSGKYVPLAKMLGDDWFAADPAVAYPQSGAFACFLLDQYQPEVTWDLYISEDLGEAALADLGMDLPALEKAFKAWLAK